MKDLFKDFPLLLNATLTEIQGLPSEGECSTRCLLVGVVGLGDFRGEFISEAALEIDGEEIHGGLLLEGAVVTKVTCELRPLHQEVTLEGEVNGVGWSLYWTNE